MSFACVSRRREINNLRKNNHISDSYSTDVTVTSYLAFWVTECFVIIVQEK